MAPKIGQRWLYQSKDKIDRFICEILPDERYIIVQYLGGLWKIGLNHPVPQSMHKPQHVNWTYLVGQDKPME